MRVSAAVCACVMVYCAWKLGAYALDALRHRQQQQELARIYYGEDIEESPAPDAPEGERDGAQPEASPSEAALAPEEALTAGEPPEEETPQGAMPEEAQRTLAKVSYPNNPSRKVSARFTRLQHQNKDIIGWLTIEGMLDEAVVQRDNSYYLRRDYRGYHSDNGAIFLDEDCAIESRPYCYILYGHNMKNGLMFGSLRDYEKVTYYREHPFITFDTMYEDGRYVIFAVGEMKAGYDSISSMNPWLLYSLNVADREEVISRLRVHSVIDSPVDVCADDQLLVLVTCTGTGEDLRRVVVARRLREGETEEALLSQVQRAKKK